MFSTNSAPNNRVTFFSNPVLQVLGVCTRRPNPSSVSLCTTPRNECGERFSVTGLRATLPIYMDPRSSEAVSLVHVAQTLREVVTDPELVES